MTVEQAIARIAELDAAIEAYPISWGPALDAMNYERKKLTIFVALHTPSLTHNKTRSEQGGASV